MSDPAEPLHEGGLKRPPEGQPADQGLTKTGGGETRGDGEGGDDRERGMIGEGED